MSDIRDTSQLRKAIRPWVFQWLQEAGLLDSAGGYGSSVVSSGGAPSPHDLSSVYHTGTLADDQAPQFLKTDGSRTLTGNFAVSPGITIDGVDLSAHAENPDAHHTAFVGLLDDFGTPITPNGSDRIGIVSLDPLLLATAGANQLQLDLDASSNPGASSKLLKTDASGGLILDGILELNGPITSSGDLVLDPVGNDVTPAAGYELNLGTRQRPFLAAHIAELQVGTLVAKEEIATVGGSLFVAPTNILAADLPASGTPQPAAPPEREDQATYTSGSFLVNTVPLTVPANATEGALALAAVCYRSNTIMITGVPGGWTPRGVFVHPASGQTIGIYSRVLTAADLTTPRPTSSWTLSGSIAAVGAIVCINEFDPSDSFDLDVVWKPGAFGHSVVADSQTTTSDQTLYLFLGVSASSCTFTPPSGMTEVVDITTSNGSSNIALTIAEEVRPTAGATGSRAAVASASANTMSVVLAITPLPGPISSSVSVKYNNFQLGDTVFLRKNGAIEFMRVASTASGSGPYTYTMTRNLDGSGMNAWVAGDAIVNTMQPGRGWLEMYAEYSTQDDTQEGPTIVAQMRESDLYGDWTPRAAFGRLKNLYDYSSGDPWGAAFGNPTGTWLGIDDINGIRIMHAATRMAQWEADGDIKLGPTNALQLNADGSASFAGSIAFGGGTHVGDATGLNVYATGTTNIFRAHDNSGLGGGVIVRDTMIMPGTIAGTIRRIMEVNAQTYHRAEFQVSAGRGGITDSYLLLGTQGVGATLMSTERLSLASYSRTGYIHVPLPTPASSANWNGTNKGVIGWTEINLALEFGLPSQIRGVFVRIVGTATATGSHALSLGGNASNAAIALRAHSTTVPDDKAGFVPCTSSGTIYYTVQGAGFTSVTLFVLGYLI